MVRCASFLILIGCSGLSLGCNVALGIGDHEPIPPDCGVDSLTNTTMGFADVRTGHCYSVVKNPTDVTHPVAQNDCIVAGGYLACISDKEEFDIINQHALHGDQMWLGMRFDSDNAVEGCDNGEVFDASLPIWRNNEIGGNGCTILAGGSVSGLWCDYVDQDNMEGPDGWICEFEHGEAKE